MLVNAKYLGVTKVGDPNDPKDAHMIRIPQCLGHSEKEIEVSEATIQGLSEGGLLEVDTLDLPYKRTVPKGEDAAKQNAEKLEAAHAAATEALEIGKANAGKLDQILAAIAAKPTAK